MKKKELACLMWHMHIQLTRSNSQTYICLIAYSLFLPSIPPLFTRFPSFPPLCTEVSSPARARSAMALAFCLPQSWQQPMGLLHSDYVRIGERKHWIGQDRKCGHGLGRVCLFDCRGGCVPYVGFCFCPFTMGFKHWMRWWSSEIGTPV